MPTYARGSVLRYLVWPLVIAGSLAAAAWGFARHAPVAVVVFVVSTVNVMVVFVLERLAPSREQVNVFRDRQTPNDIGHGILVGGLARPLAGPAALATLAAAGRLIGHQPRHLWWPSGAPFVVQILLGLGVFSFGGYWTHRWCHTTGWLWRFHVLHHDTTEMQVLKGNRIHIGEDIVRQWFVLVPLYALGVPASVLVWMSLWNNFEGSIAHSNIDCRLPAFAHWIAPTPQNHLLHHSAQRTLQAANYAGVTPLWDVLFGTFKHPARHVVGAYGVESSPVPRAFASQLLFPFSAPHGSTGLTLVAAGE
jgi:sterol desaturase/sphingolipid hydroxylase (fatty acid hydroxylase superfamily)